jgi:hypothetical protein
MLIFITSQQYSEALEQIDAITSHIFCTEFFKFPAQSKNATYLSKLKM